uniref:Obscurin-like protein 1 n=1 Tax=Oryzias latipes TaxID=8090 RepID=A0A3P9K2F2_ORYLA
IKKAIVMDIFGGAPRVLGYPRPVVAQCGTDATLRCQISGDPRPDVIWERKNVQILPEKRYKISEEGKLYLLTITGVTQQDAGQYICKARNSVGETYAAASLKKWNNGSNDKLQDPLSLRVDRGEDAAFSCKLWGTPLPLVTWEKDGKKLNDIFESSHFSVTNQDGGWFQLKIYRTRMPDKGVYTCKAMNCHGEALAGAVLLVESVPEREDSRISLNSHSNSQWSPKSRGGRLSLSKLVEETSVSASKVKKFAVTEGKHAKFRCFVTGKPKPEIIWKKDGVPLEPGRRHLIFEDREGYYTLKVLYCKVQDTGLYVCAASNALGNTLSAVHLTVQGKLFQRPLKDEEVKERDAAVLECEVPDETVQTAWYLEDQRLMPSSKYAMEQKGTRRRLTIHDVGTDDDGVYLCEMPNGAKSIAELSVKGSIVRKLPRKLEVLEGENAAFCVEVQNDDMEVHWFKDGLKLHETHQTILKSFGKTHILVFVNVAHHDSGVVTFVVGRSKTSSRLKVKATRHCPPIGPAEVKMDIDRPNSALLSWERAPNSQTTTRSIFVLEMQEVGSQEWHKCFTSETATSAEVTGDAVPCEGNYRFRICSINKYGRSGHVEFPKVVHLGACTLNLKTCEVTQGEDAHFSIELSASMPGTWFLNSSQLNQGGRYSIQQRQTTHSLVIHKTETAEDMAEITFIANGVRDSAVLKVKRTCKTSFCHSYIDINKRVDTGDAIVLYCEVSHPLAKVSWFKDGNGLEVMEGLNIQAEGNMRRIVIQSASASHSGVYTCQMPGDVITFNVDVAGKKTLLVNCNMHKNGQEVQPSDNITLQVEGTMRRLIIRSAERSDAGCYTCQAGKNNVVFTVNVKVMIVEPIEDVVMKIYIPEEINLQCELSRSNGKVRWLKDGEEVQDNDLIQLVSEGPYRKLTILRSCKEDSGEYICETNGDSVFFQVTATEPPVRIISPSDSEVGVTHLASERLELCCEISKVDAPVRWYKDNLEIEEGPNLILEVDEAKRLLVIPLATVEDTGEYVCDTEDDSTVFLVTITEPPVLILRKSEIKTNLEFLVSDDIVLECELSRDNAKAKWYKDGVRVEGDERFCEEEEGAFRSLVILNAELTDSGKYLLDVGDDTPITLLLVEPPVTIVGNSYDPDHQEMVAGDDLILACEVSRASAPVSWYCNDKLLICDSRTSIESYGAVRKIIISCIQPSDSGKYICDAIDDKMICTVRIQEPPVTFVNKEEDIVVTGYEAESVTLTSYVSKETAHVRWLKDWTPVEGERFCALTEGHQRTLTIEPLRRSDAGEYTCDANTDQLHFSLLFLTELHNTSVMEGEAATFKCVVSPEDVQLVWLMDNEPIMLGDRFQATQNGLCHTLVIKKCQLLDSSKISAEAEGKMTKASLKVQEAQVMFTKKMEAVMAEEFGEATLETEISLETGEVQWMRQGVVIQSGPRYTLGQNGCKRSLTIRNLSLSDRGTYRCETLHDRAQVKLNVEPRKISIRKGLTDQETVERETASFEVELSHKDVEGTWQKDGIRVKPNNQFRVSANGRFHGLTLSNLSMEDTGTIVFSAEGVRTTARLTVKETPVSILKPLADVRVEEEFPATLECELSRQNVEVKWFKDGVEVRPGKNCRIYSMGRKRFCQILQCSLADSGCYTCDSGEINTSCSLQVYEHELVIVKELEDLNIKEEQNAVFMCEVSLEDVSGEWYKNNQRIRPSSTTKMRTEGTKHFLLICNVTAEDAGEICFAVRNLKSTAYLEIEELPVSIVKPLRDRTALEKHRVILECTVSSPRGSATWYKGKRELESSDRVEIVADGCSHKLVIHQVDVEDEGTYSIEIGEHTSQAKLLVEGKFHPKFGPKTTEIEPPLKMIYF